MLSYAVMRGSGIAGRRFLIGATLWLQGGLSVLKRVWDYLHHEVRIGKFNISLASLALGTAIFLLAVIISRMITSVLQRRISKRVYIDPGIRYTMIRLVHYTIIFVGVLYAFQVAFNADLTTLAVVFTALSVGIGFGLQYIAHDIASGFILLFERPVRIGDRVTIGEDEGDVQSINLRTTIVMTNDRIAVIVPNSKIVSQRLINWSYGDPRARISIPIGVALDSDVELVTKTLLRAPEGVENILEQPAPSVQFMKFGDTSLEFRLLVWTNKPRSHTQIRSDINYRIERLFREERIEIPSRQIDLRLQSGPLQVDRGDNLLAEELKAEDGRGASELSRK